MPGGQALAASFRVPADVEKLQRLVELRLRAYDVDACPAHVLTAWRAIREAGLQPTERMLCYLDKVLERGRFPNPGARRPQYALRDVRILDALRELTGRPEIPPILAPGILARLAAQFRMQHAAIGMVVSRLRRRGTPA